MNKTKILAIAGSVVLVGTSAGLFFSRKEGSEDKHHKTIKPLVEQTTKAEVTRAEVNTTQVNGEKRTNLVELNEAFASQSIACIKDLEINPDIVNVNGGAIAFGHPLGASGARILTTLLYEMKRRKARYGLATMCVGVGQGIATVIENIE